MKKLLRLFCFISGILGAMAAINRLTFKRASETPGPKKPKNYVFDWRHGKISYTAAGRGRPLLLLHSLFPGASSAEWRRVISRLARNHRVYALDFLGYGRSGKPDISYSAYLLASLANDFIDCVIGRPASVAACAQSAPLAAAGAQLRPELYEKLILVSPAESDAPTRIPTASDIARGLVIWPPVVGTFAYLAAVSRRRLRAFLANSLASGNTRLADSFLEDFYRAAHCGGPDSRHSYRAYISGLLDANCGERLAKIRKPIAVIYGTETVESFPPLKNSPKTACVRMIKKAGIFPHIDRPGEFCGAIEDFLNE